MATQTFSTPSPPVDAKEELRRKIDAEIQHLRLRIANLAGQRNELAPVAALPSEVIALIFTLARDTTPTSASAGYRTPSLEISWVCKRWRDIAIGCGRLWSFIDSVSLPEMDMFLERSKREALITDLFWLKRFQEGDEAKEAASRLVVERASREIHRTQDLQIVWLARSGRYLSLPHLEQNPAPLLRKLSLTSVAFPDLFNGDAPVLERLVLLGCHCPAAATLLRLPTLRSLNISHPAVSLLPIDSVLLALTHLSALECLYLRGALDPEPVNMANLPTAVLPRLRILDIERGATPATADLLRHVRVPASARVTVSAFSPYDENEQNEVIRTTLSTCRGQDDPLSQLSVLGTHETVAIGGNTEGGGGGALDGDAKRTGLSFLMEADQNLPFRPDAASVLQAASDVLDLSNVKTVVVIDRVGSVTDETLRRTLGGLANLRTLKLHDAAAFAFLQFLAHEAFEGVDRVYKGGWSEVAGELGILDEETDAEEDSDDEEDEEIRLYDGEDPAHPSTAAIGCKRDSSEEAIPDPNSNATTVLETIGVSFRSLRVLALSFPEFTHSHAVGEIFDENRPVILNLAIRKLNGIGLNWVEYVNWEMTPKHHKRFKALWGRNGCGGDP